MPHRLQEKLCKNILNYINISKPLLIILKGGGFLTRASDLKNKEIINLKNNERLGYICDFEICTSTGEISAIIIPLKNKIFFTQKNKGYRIPWGNICGFGEDIILVNIDIIE